MAFDRFRRALAARMLGVGDDPLLVRARPDGRYDVLLRADQRAALDAYLDEVDRLLTEAPDDASLRRLHPPAYLEDPERDQAYQLLAGDELRDSRRAAIEAVRQSLDATDLDEDGVWTWLRAVNGLRLVLSTRLGIEEEGQDGSDLVPGDPDAVLWDVYDFVTWVEESIVDALQGGA